ncbi:putative Nicotinate mononucleotide:5,6-dimethylbenzimidazole phosphoribosyltransferase (CobT) [Vibrio nigripulchritudo SFn27]|uniref:Nicotinate-nucleotide--dimethylbenzimidazole phosphoribosyltransferase n=1 Tax=Vibrio nigripulchritudo TaxID=28173 RepID=U4KF40_9VIBR|nr:nicotinate-nucleotide--dimethylbenzimidazole phosphoribosyltransferase [Vibrio nigripulchritudo]CCN85226.1 putative Nicotinate mononucleotide:5,6-dimethylbenzimidazole phosphoribosyltransferase (CobT) [Vibrio nigripulchritudo BLFn1]CCN87624.1 putative Nicotinate mononucleotide:5,6-dimethylbenzimidazole phosphoribosyltransferase (CobT) [Vibrio nigripulchritudo SFn27]CCN92505.1 putative Nicotinate mononucleotide:5,6-dimethylbenzimidazole phosphoribosyltransferase (CobT) [Vibrio nigripulchritudo
MLDQTHSQYIKDVIDQKTKPRGALGLLEDTAHHLALIQSQGKSEPTSKIELSKPHMLVFAGDHGIAREGVSIAPSEVTYQMVQNFLAGGAAINCFCKLNNIALSVIDTGILTPIESQQNHYHVQRLGSGTENFAEQSAMSRDTAEKGIQLGRKVVDKLSEDGLDMLMFGEMGIGNTSSASALLSLALGIEAEDSVGVGTGITQEQLKKKIDLVQNAISRCKRSGVSHDPINILSEVGGYEIVQMVGAFLAAQEKNIPVLVDGFIVSVAGFLAIRIEPKVRDVMLFAHCSEEHAHRLVLEALQAKPMIDLGLRLGEGTGAALAYPLVLAAAAFYNDMASFQSAGVTV